MRVPKCVRACMCECVTRVPYSRGFAIWFTVLYRVCECGHCAVLYNIVAVTVNLPTRLAQTRKHTCTNANTDSQMHTFTFVCVCVSTHSSPFACMYICCRRRCCCCCCSRFVVPWIHMCTFVYYCYCNLMLRLCDKSVRMCWRQYSVRCTASNRKRWIGTPQTTMFVFRTVYMENCDDRVNLNFRHFICRLVIFFPLDARCDSEHRSLLIQHLPDMTDDVIMMLFVCCVVLCCEIWAQYFKSIWWTWNECDKKYSVFHQIYSILFSIILVLFSIVNAKMFCCCYWKYNTN